MGSRSARPLLLACTALVAVTAILPARAQDATTATTTGNGEETQLQTIIVKGKRVAAASVAGTAPEGPTVSTTSAEQLRKSDVTSIEDLGNTTEPGVNFVTTSPGNPGGLYIRGLGKSRVVTLVDGIPIPYFENYARGSQATTSYNDTSASFDFSSLSSVDVLRGADSSRTGSGALGGALVLRTLEPEDIIGENRDWGVIAKTGYDSRDRSVGGSVAVAKKVENTSVLFQGSYTRGHETETRGDVDTLGSTRTEANPAEYYQDNLLFKLRQDLEGGHRIGLTLERFARNEDVDMKTMQVSYQPGFAAWDDTLRERASLDYSFEAPSEDSVIDAASLSVYWQGLSKDAGSAGNTASTGAAYERRDTYNQRGLGATGGFTTSSFDIGGLQHTLRFGGNVERFSFDEYLYSLSGASSAASSADMPEVTGTRVGLYVEDEISAQNGLTITPGLRFDWYDYNPDGSTSSNSGYNTFGLPVGQDGSRFSPKILATYDLTPELQLFAQYSTAYRAPSINELYLNFSNTAYGYAVTGNSDLDPETSQGFEVGAKYASDDLTGSVNLFHNKYKNFIEQYTTTSSLYTNPFTGGAGTLYTYRNRANVEISGIEAKVRKDLANGFFTHASVAYTYGKDTDTDELIASVAPFKSIVGIGYDQETWGTELTGVFSSHARDDNDATTYDAPGYGIANLTAWWEPEQMNGLRVQAGVYNIFDKKYWNAIAMRDINPTATSSSTNQPIDYYSEAGRSFKISITKTF